VDTIFAKFFRGRNVGIKLNDLKYLIKHSLNITGPFYFLEKLVKYLLSKENGGARTSHQINQVFNMITYILDLSTNKINDENTNSNSNTSTLSNFKEKFFSIDTMTNFSKKIIEIIKENVKSETKQIEEEKSNEEVKEDPKEEDMNEENKEKNAKKAKRLAKKMKKEKNAKNAESQKNNYFFIGLINFFEKFIHTLIKAGIQINNSDKLNKKLKSTSSILEKIVENYKLNNMKKKVTEIKEKTFTQVE
jgi:hypothetical protein